MFSDLKERILLTPNFELGDSVEYEATLESKKGIKPGDFWFVHYPTLSVPVLSETVVLDLPADREIAFLKSADIPAIDEVANGRHIYRWKISNPEPAPPSPDPVEPLFAVSSIKTWDAFGDWIRSLNRHATEPTAEIAALAAKLTAGKTTEPEKIAALYSYVATKVRYVSISIGIGHLQPHDASTVLQNAFGDCKDQTALLSALLTASGFKAHPVLTTPGAGVRAPGVPAPDQFTHEFTAVDTASGLIFLDPSMGPVPAQVLAPGVRGKTALLVEESKSSVIEIPANSPVPKRITSALKGQVTAAGVFEGTQRYEVEGLAELAPRRQFMDATDAEKEKAVIGISSSDLNNAKVRQIVSGDPSDLTKPFWIQYQIHKDDFFPSSKSKMQINDAVNPSILDNLRALNKPEKPLPLEAFTISTSMDLIVDRSITSVNGMPKHLKTPFGSYDSEYKYEAGHLLHSSSFVLNGIPIPPADWKAFVDFVESINTDLRQGFSLEHPPPSPVRPTSTQALTDANAAIARRDWATARSGFQEVTRNNPQNAGAWFNLALSYENLREYKDAEAAYKQSLELNPKQSGAYNNLGLVARAQSHLAEAETMFRKSIELNVRNATAHGNFGDLLGGQGKWEEARKEYALAAEITPENSNAWLRMGRAQIKTGHPDDGRKSFDKALDLTHNETAENSIAYALAEANMDLDKAWRLISGTLNPAVRAACESEVVLTNTKCSSEVRALAPRIDTAGWILYRQGKTAEAAQYLIAAHAVVPLNEIGLHVAVVLAKLGRLEEAQRRFADLLNYTQFTNYDLTDARAALGDPLPAAAKLPEKTARVIALVDPQGKVVEAQPAGKDVPEDLVVQAKSISLIPITLAERSLRTVRTIEFQKIGDEWSVYRSWVGSPTDGPPPASAR
jgi:Tfp pilus assembly protein PilF